MNLAELEQKIPSWAKWLALAVLLLLIFGSPFTTSADYKRCKQSCKQQNFADFRFKPHYNSKSGPSPSSCHCLTLEESQDKSRIHPGTRVF